MSDSSFEDSVEECALTTSHLTLKCSCGYPPVLPFVFGLINSVNGHGYRNQFACALQHCGCGYARLHHTMFTR